MATYRARAARTALTTFLQASDGYNSLLALKRTEIGSGPDAYVPNIATFSDYAHKPRGGASFPYLSVFMTGANEETEPNSRLHEFLFAMQITTLNKKAGGNLDLVFAAVDDYVDAMYTLFDRRDGSSIGSILGDDHVPGRVLEARLGNFRIRSDSDIELPNITIQWPSVSVLMIEDF